MSRAPSKAPTGASRTRGEVVLDRLTWRPYGRREPVLRDLSLRIRPGERVLLAGPSGSGKSTLLRAIAGLLRTADAGDLDGAATVDGHPPGERAGEIGLVLQEPGAGVVAATVGRDVAFGLENIGAAPADMPARIADALAAVGLTMPQDTPTHALSGGETQRLALAGALALAPSVLLLDEPTAMLDPDHAAQVRRSVGQVMAATGLTTVVVEHVLGPWVDLVERLIVLDADGGVVADGSVGEVLAAQRDRLLDMGIWVPGAPPPEPVTVPAGLLGAGATGGPGIRATALTVDREVTLLDGATRTVPALAAAALEPGPRTTTALVGPSGAGKSTLLLTLAGLLEPTTGRVTADRTPVHELGSRELATVLAWVPQWSSATITARTVLDEVLTTSRALGRDPVDARTRAEAVLGLLGLDHLASADPRQLSGGEQRRLSLAAALLHGPAVLLADEPTVGQDRQTWAAVAGLLDAHRTSGRAGVVTTHDPALVGRADEVVRVDPPPRPAQPPPATHPLLTRCGPLSLLAASALAVPAGVASPDWRTSLVVILVELVLGSVGLMATGPGRRPRGLVRRLLVRLGPGLVGALSVGWSTWLLGGHDLELAALGLLRVVIIVLPSALLIPFVDPDRLGDHAAQRLHLPARPVVAVSAALQRVHTLGETWREIGRARRVRGIGVSARSPRTVLAQVGAMTFGLLVRSLRLAADLAAAMDARGFATAYRRTWYAPAPWRPADTLLVLLALLPLATAVLLPLR